MYLDLSTEAEFIEAVKDPSTAVSFTEPIYGRAEYSSSKNHIRFFHLFTFRRSDSFIVRCQIPVGEIAHPPVPTTMLNNVKETYKVVSNRIEQATGRRVLPGALFHTIADATIDRE